MDNKEISAETDFGAEFSNDRKYRFALWRIWDRSKPLVMFIGLNPSTANETDNDPTIKSCGRIAKANGYGGFYMMNCFPFISTDPKALATFERVEHNRQKISEIAKICNDVVFAWGNFKIVKSFGIDHILHMQFPDALCIDQNKNGSPKHPLYCKSSTSFRPFK